MGKDQLAADTEQIRQSADGIAGGKPTAPSWGYSKVPVELMANVRTMLAAVDSGVQRGTGFAAQVATGFDSFSQINRACANDYDHNDAQGVEKIAATTATTFDQRSMVTQIKGERGFWQGVQGYWGAQNEQYHLPPAVKPVN